MENSYTIAEEFELPSKGLIYSKEVNPLVKLRSWTTEEEARRLSPNNQATQYKKIADLIEACMIEKPAISVYDMCLGDYEFLLHKARIVTYGPKYSSIDVCSKCNNIEEIEIDLDKETVKSFNREDEEKFKSLMTITLPVSKKEIVLRYHTPRILDNIKAKAEELRKETKDNNIDFEFIATLNESISTVDGVKLSYLDKETFIKKLPARDSNYIRNRIDKINNMIGLTNEFKYTCKKCGEENLTFFRFGPEFFRPVED